MSSLFGSSIGKKLIMSISGIFLMMFLVLHLGINSLMLIGDGTIYNQAAHFMATNPFIKIMEPLLGLGFLVHIIYGIYLYILNEKARPVKYNRVNQSGSSTWMSRNMIYLGLFILIYLVIHIINFWWKIKFTGDPLLSEVEIGGETMHNTYALVSSLFINYWWYDVIYILGAIFLGLHLTHGFWSSFQTLGWSNNIWKKRLYRLGLVYTFVVAGGYAIIPLYFLLFKLGQ